MSNPRVTLSKDDFINALHEQVDFLRTSIALYDGGKEIEAKRLAVTLRTLLHDTKNSRALLTSLGIKKRLNFWEVMGTAPEDSLVFIGCCRLETTRPVSDS
jgi:hypothetical protein